MPLPGKIIQKLPYILYKLVKYKQSQYWTKEKLKQFQIKNLQGILYHAKNNIPYYKELFRKVSLDPDKVKSITDLNVLPILTRQDIIKDTEKFIAKNHQDFNPSWRYTSGTTGSPLSFLLDKKAELARLASLLRCWSWTGYFPGNKIFSLQQGASVGFKGVKKLSLQRTLKLTAASLDRKNALRAQRLLLQFNPQYYIAYPYSLVNFLRYGLENRAKIHKPRTVICSGENLDISKREYIKSTLDCEVFDFYSHEESIVMGMEDKNGSKYLLDDFGIHEIIDEKTGEKVKPGGIGLLIGTSLNNYSMPFLRYQVDDRIQTLLPEEKSSGKIHFQQFKKLLGRKDDVIHTPEGKKLSFLVDILHLKLDGIIASQLVQEKLDVVKLKIIKGENFSPGNIPKIKKEMQNLICTEMRYEFEFVEKLEVNKQGKTPFIISRLDKEE